LVGAITAPDPDGFLANLQERIERLAELERQIPLRLDKLGW